MDEVVTHAEVLRWLPRDVVEALTLAMPPEQRGWFTEAEVASRPGGRFVEAQTMSEREPRYYATGGIVAVPFFPLISSIVAPTTVEIQAGVRR
jgi:hypothetical protein